MIVINFKNYKFGKAAIDLVRQIDIYCNTAVIAVPAIDLKEIVATTTLPVYAQHIDAEDPGRSTGFILPESLALAGAKGTLINHSEHPVKLDHIKQVIDRCRNTELKVIVCAKNLAEVKKIKKLSPFAIAFEDPNLIATGKSVTTYNPESLRAFVELLQDTTIIPLCGAGISLREDVAAALKLGCKGVLVASAVASAPNPEKFLQGAAEELKLHTTQLGELRSS